VRGSHPGGITVGPGQSLYVAAGATVDGAVTVQAGGSLEVEDATLHGQLTVRGGGVLRICGSTLKGAVSVSGSTGLVVIGDDEGAPACRGNSVAGSVSVVNGKGGVEFDFNTVTGPVTITGNTGSVPPPDTGSVVAVGDTDGPGSVVQ
jgi:hypothetical protein